MIFTKVLRFQPNRPLHGLGLLLRFTIEVIEGVIQSGLIGLKEQVGFNRAKGICLVRSSDQLFSITDPRASVGIRGILTARTWHKTGQCTPCGLGPGEAKKKDNGDEKQDRAQLYGPKRFGLRAA